MPPDASLSIIATIQTAISALLTTYEPEFLLMSQSMFMSFAAIMIGWHGLEMMSSSQPINDRMFAFAEFLMHLSFGYAMVMFYESPIPGLGVSFSNLITDQAAALMNILDARAVENMDAHLSVLWGAFVAPDAWSILANLIYWVLLLVVMIAKVVSMSVVAYGLIASAACALLGPLFVPFFIVPQLNWLFNGWLRAFIQYSFIPVVALAWLMIGEKFIYAYVTTLPPIITEEGYLVYGVQAMVVVLTFCTGLAAVPMLTSSIFSGHAHGSGGTSVIAMLRRIR